MDNPRRVVDDDADVALKLQIEAIERDEQLRQAAERDEAIATKEQAEQFFASSKAALLALEGEDYARKVQINQEVKGLELYTQYPHLDLVKGDSRVGPTIATRPPPAAAIVPQQKTRVLSTPPGSPSHSPAGSPRSVGGIATIKSWLPFGSGKQEKAN